MEAPEWTSFHQQDNYWSGLVRGQSFIEVAEKPIDRFRWYFTYRDKDYAPIENPKQYGFRESCEALYFINDCPPNTAYVELRLLGDTTDEPRLFIDLFLL